MIHFLKHNIIIKTNHSPEKINFHPDMVVAGSGGSGGSGDGEDMLMAVVV